MQEKSNQIRNNQLEHFQFSAFEIIYLLYAPKKLAPTQVYWNLHFNLQCFHTLKHITTSLVCSMHGGNKPYCPSLKNEIKIKNYYLNDLFAVVNQYHIVHFHEKFNSQEIISNLKKIEFLINTMKCVVEIYE